MADIPERTKMKTCPFCGTADPLGGSTLDEGCYVMCRNEDCFGMVGYFENQSEADAAWNTRAAPPAMDREAVGITPREVDALRYLLNWDGTGKRVSSVMKTFTLNGGERSYTKDALESLWAKLSTLSADAIRQGEGVDGYVLAPAVATRAMVDAADACTDAYSAYTAMVQTGGKKPILAADVLTEEWLADVLQDTLEMDWNTTDGARGIVRALKNGLVTFPQSGGQILSALYADGGSKVVFGHRSPTGDQGPVAVGQATQASQIGDADAGEVIERPSMQREAEGVVADHQFKPHVCECGERFCTGSELTWHQVQQHDLAPTATPASHASDGGKA